MARNDKDILNCTMAQVGAEMIRIATKRGLSAEQSLNAFLDHCISAFDISQVKSHRTYEEWAKAVLETDADYAFLVWRWMQDVNKALTGGLDGVGFCDFFGRIYESTFQSKGKASSLGQFYTPEHLCYLMAEMTSDFDYDQKIIKFNDSACGSSRTLLAGLAVQNRDKEQLKRHRYVFLAEDIDIVSCKMSALNLMAHCAYGAVVRHDTLMYDAPDTVYIINECQVPYPNNVMCIHSLYGDEARNWWNNGGVARLEQMYGEEWQGKWSDEKKSVSTFAEEKKQETKELQEQSQYFSETADSASTEPDKKGEWVQLSLFDRM